MPSTIQVHATKSPAASAPAAAQGGPHFNALKHGLRSGTVLLPGDDVAAFRTLRHRLFHLYQPRTVEEAQCVETIAASHWRIARCRLELSGFKRHLGAVLSGDPNVTGYLCDPDPHRVHHRGTDCVLEEGRLEKFKSKAQATLALLQRQRTQNLTVGKAAALEDYRVFLAEGDPIVDEAPAEEETAPAAEGAATAATGSEDGGNGNSRKREVPAPAVRFPKHWSRRQREAAARREAQP
jgi:hypothetical protein